MSCVSVTQSVVSKMGSKLEVLMLFHLQLIVMKVDFKKQFC